MKRPAFMFYAGDWRRDPGLRVCSLAARGLWIDMLSIMHEAEPYGHLAVNGDAVSEAELARLVGESLPVAKRLLKELEARNIFSRTEAGVIYSRRMVRDEQARVHRAEGGKLGGNPTLLARPKVQPKEGGKDNTKDKGRDKRKDNLRDNLRPTPSVAVALSGAEEPSTSPRDAAGSGGESEPAVTWLTPYLAAWEAQYGGPMAVEPNVSALRWLEQKFGADETLRRWRIYLAATGAQYASAAKLKSGWGQWESPPVTLSRGAALNSPTAARAAVLWPRYKANNLLTKWQRPEYERIGAELVQQGLYPTVAAFLDELRVTKPWELGDARTDGYAINELAARLAGVQAVAS